MAKKVLNYDIISSIEVIIQQSFMILSLKINILYK